MSDMGAEAYRRYLDGESDQFDRIIELFHDNLIFYINRYVHNIQDAEDIAMDTFADLIIHKHRYRFKSSLKTYLFSVASHKAIDFIRKRKHETVWNDDAMARMASDEDALEASVVKEDTRRALLRAIDQLSADYRSAVYLVYFENMSYDEAGFVLKKSRKQINNLCYRAKTALKKLLEKEGITSYAE